MTPPFPKKSVAWSGAILGGIVNAIMTAQSMGFSAFRYWRDNHYVLNGQDGRDGVISFAGGHWYPDSPLVGVFFYAHSNRSPFHCEEPYDLERFFRNCPR